VANAIQPTNRWDASDACALSDCQSVMLCVLITFVTFADDLGNLSVMYPPSEYSYFGDEH
jgi:hypothetical protein